jgi:DNA modification methylase
VVTLKFSTNTAINYTTGYVLFIFIVFMKKLEWTTKKIKVADLIELEFNPRKISEEKRKKLIESIEKFNLVEIPAVNTDMKIIGGNQRVKALIIAGRGDELIDVRVPNRKLSQKEVKEYNLISNSHAGEFDFDIIMSDFGDIDFSDIGFDIGKIEFETSDLFDKSFNKFEKKKEIKNKSQVEEDYFDESQNEIKTDIVYGDLFQIGRHRLLCGDSTKSNDYKKLLNGKLADLIFTDPPYDLEDSYSQHIFDSAKEDCHIFIMNSDKLLIENVNNGIKWFRKFFAIDFKIARLVSNNQPMTRVDLIAEFCKGKTKFNNLYDGFSTLIECAKIHNENDSINFGHKQAKRIELPAIFITHYSLENEIVCDFFGGSGSTMAACEQLNRTCYMIEFSPENCQRIINRMEKIYNLKAIKL